MATTKIHAVHVAPNRCIAYAMNDKIGVERDNISGNINYEKIDGATDVRYKTLSSFLNCHEGNATKTFHKYADNFRGTFRKEAPRTKNGKEVVAWHLTQNFKGHEISPQAANEIGLRLAKEMFKGFPVVVSTHTDTDNIHNHIVVCAWNDEGRKWNNDNTNYRKIRETSDRLCAEYKASVLEETRKVKLVSYIDQEGKKRFYEPTARKDKIIKERAKSGDIENINDYRRTVAHLNKTIGKEFVKETIKSDLDRLLPISSSYDDLMLRLQSEGYRIKDKNKKGGNLKYLTFIRPNEVSGVRGNNIGDGASYTREGLEKYFDNIHFEKHTEIAPTHSSKKEEHQLRKNGLQKQISKIENNPELSPKVISRER